MQNSSLAKQTTKRKINRSPIRRISVITSTRADYGLLYPLLRSILDDAALELQLVVTGAHLSPVFGSTVSEIEKDQIPISMNIPIFNDSSQSHTEAETARVTARMITGATDAFEKLKPNIVVVLGDRYEILGAATAAFLMRIPVAHISGGEVTRGAIDDSIRHALTKISSLHFVTTASYARRVKQLGENPNLVFNFGSLALENIRNTKLLSRTEVEADLCISLKNNSLLVTFHPETTALDGGFKSLLALLVVLEQMPDVTIIFTQPNADAGALKFNRAISDFVKQNGQRSILVSSLGRVRYLSLLKHVTAVVGNSSSGITEVPSFGIPTINIGDRQAGRLRAPSILDVPGTMRGIRSGIMRALDRKFQKRIRKVKSPYDGGATSRKIKNKLKAVRLSLLKSKAFKDI